MKCGFVMCPLCCVCFGVFAVLFGSCVFLSQLCFGHVFVVSRTNRMRHMLLVVALLGSSLGLIILTVRYFWEFGSVAQRLVKFMNLQTRK